MNSCMVLSVNKDSTHIIKRRETQRLYKQHIKYYYIQYEQSLVCADHGLYGLWCRCTAVSICTGSVQIYLSISREKY